MQNLLLLHGALGATDQLQPLATALKDRHTIHTMNFSGHGGTAFSDQFSIEGFSGELARYINEQSIDSTHIFGYSMGGYVAMHYARQYPEKVKSIITLGTKFYWDGITAAKEIKMLDAEKIEMKVPAFAEELRHRHQPNDWKEVLAKTRDMMIDMGRNNPLSLEDFAAIATPSLLLLGEKDNMVTTEETVGVQQVMHNAEYRQLRGEPHPIGQVNMMKLAEIIVDFTQRHGD